MKYSVDCVKDYGSYYNVQLKVENGELFRIEKGIYSDKEYVPDLAILSFKYPNAVITLNTAFYLYDLTDEVPEFCTMATKREAAPIVDKRVKQIFIPKELLEVGKTTIDYKGYTITIFNKERMLIELIRYKSKLPFNYYKEILNNYRKLLPVLNAEKIKDYAELMPKKGKIISVLRTEVY